MSRQKLSLKTTLWLMALIGAFLAGLTAAAALVALPGYRPLPLSEMTERRATMDALEDREMAGPGEHRVYRLDVERPFDFLRKFLPAALVKRKGSLRGDDAVDGATLVSVCRGSECVEMQIELLSGVQMDSDKYYIRLGGAPATLEEAYSLALRLCAVARIPDDRIVAWRTEKKYRNVLTRTQLQTASDGTNTHAVEVRSSLELKGDQPWRVMYTLYFSPPEQAEGEMGIDAEGGGQLDGIRQVHDGDKAECQDP